MRRFLAAVAAAAALLALASPAAAKNPWEELMGRKPHVWTDPEGRFYLDLPVGWQAKPREGAPVVDIWKNHPDYGYTAHVTVQMRTVPPGVNVKHFALRVHEDTQKAAPGYQPLDGEQMKKVTGVPAVYRHFVYRERGNAELVNEVKQYVFIVGERAYVVTMEHAYGVANVFAEDFDLMIQGFVGRTPGQDHLRTPKKRKRIRAGEMVNPDAIKY